MHYLISKAVVVLMLARPVPAPQFRDFSAASHLASLGDGVTTALAVRNPNIQEAWSSWMVGRRPGIAESLVSTQAISWGTDVLSRTKFGQKHPWVVRSLYLSRIGSGAFSTVSNGRLINYKPR
jgi:hypothetical protein